jgi:hypothetical protein
MRNTEVVGYIPKLLFKLYTYLKNRFDPPKPPKDEEMYCISICEKLILMEDSKLYYSPLSHKRFIRNENKDMFIALENLTINLINHVYSYNVYIETGNHYDNVVKKFDEELERRRELLEEEIKTNIKHSLKSILDKVSI